MIGHYLGTLTMEQEDRVLTNEMRPGALLHDDDSRCLLGVTMDVQGIASARRVAQICGANDPPRRGKALYHVGLRFDELWRRFDHRVNIAIRNRILSNRARRTLQNRPASIRPVVEVV